MIDLTDDELTEIDLRSSTPLVVAGERANDVAGWPMLSARSENRRRALEMRLVAEIRRRRGEEESACAQPRV